MPTSATCSLCLWCWLLQDDPARLLLLSGPLLLLMMLLMLLVLHMMHSRDNQAAGNSTTGCQISTVVHYDAIAVVAVDILDSWRAWCQFLKLLLLAAIAIGRRCCYQ